GEAVLHLRLDRGRDQQLEQARDGGRDGQDEEQRPLAAEGVEGAPGQRPHVDPGPRDEVRRQDPALVGRRLRGGRVRRGGREATGRGIGGRRGRGGGGDGGA